MAIRYILFDAVGTLIYPEPSVAAAYELMARKHGVELTREEIAARFPTAYRRVFARPDDLATSEAADLARWRTVVAEVFHESPHSVDAILTGLWEHFSRPQHWPLYDDVAAVWAELESRGYVLGIASNFDARLRRILAGHACLADCSHIFLSTELGYAKPSPSFFQQIQRRLGVAPRELLMVGDDELHDVAAARTAGWQAMRINRSAPVAGELGSLRELLDPVQ
jgi:putative hydrolase of the HAD superfamily